MNFCGAETSPALTSPSKQVLKEPTEFLATGLAIALLPALPLLLATTPLLALCPSWPSLPLD